MGLVLTASEIAILGSRFQAGAGSGHSQKVSLAATVTMPTTPAVCHFPWACVMPNGQASLIFHGDTSIYFLAYKDESNLYSPIQIFTFDDSNYCYGLVVWNGGLLAIARNGADGKLHYRQSWDNGVTWTADALLGLTYADAQVVCASPKTYTGFQVATDAAGTTLYIFSVNTVNAHVTEYRSTTNSDPTLGWSALASTGFTVPSYARNYGGTTARNQGLQRGWVFCACWTSPNWMVVAESDDGDFHANHAVFKGQLSAGGSFTTQATLTNPAQDTGLVAFASPVTARYWQFTFSGLVTLGYGTVYTIELTDSTGATNYALLTAGATAYGKWYSLNYVPNNTIDGSDTTYWQAPSATSTILIDLGSAQTIAKYRIYQVFAPGNNQYVPNITIASATSTPDGLWQRTMDDGYGGGISGGQGANGGVFRGDTTSKIIWYAMDDNGDDATRWTSTDDGATWGAGVEIMPAGYDAGIGIGAGAGFSVPNYSKLNYIWGWDWSTNGLGVHECADATNFTEIFGTGATATYYSRLDVSNRVKRIGKDSSIEMHSDACQILFQNTDGACNPDDSSAALYAYLKQPGAVVTVYQWHGPVANAVQTFSGTVARIEVNAPTQECLITVQDAMYPLLLTEILPTAPQDSNISGAVLTTANYVYQTMYGYQIINDLLNVKGAIAASQISLAHDTYQFTQYQFASGTLGDALLKVARDSGVRLWANESGVFKSQLLTDLSATSYWTWKASVDVTDISTVISDEGAYTDVKVIGKGSLTSGSSIIGSAVSSAFATTWGQHRVKVIRDRDPRSVADCNQVASDILTAVAKFYNRRTLGVIGHPGVQKADRVTLSLPGQVISADFRVLSIRSEQDAEQGTYKSIAVVEPWT